MNTETIQNAYASTDSIALIFSPLIAISAFLWTRKRADRFKDILEDSRVGLRRRFIAFYIDAMIAMLCVMPFTVLPMLGLEYFATGEWVWGYQRDYFRKTDAIMVILMLLNFYLIFYYFKWHFAKDKQTIGQYLMEFKVLPNGTQPAIRIRLLTAWANAAWWPIWPWTIFKRQQDYWWDRTSQTKARRVSKG